MLSFNLLNKKLNNNNMNNINLLTDIYMYSP